MNQDRDLVEEERQARLAARAEDRPRRSGGTPGMDSGTKKLALVAGGLGALLVLMVGGWSLLGHRPAGIPVLGPPPGPVRVKPADPGGMQLMGAQVAQTNGPGAQALAPGPEEAAPQALEAQVDAARKAEQPAPPPSAPKAGHDAMSEATAPPIDPGSGAGPLTHAPVVKAPTAVPPTPPEPPPAPDAAVAPAASGGRHAVQLAALDSDQAARAEWSRLTHKAPSLFGARTPVVVVATRDGKQFYRLRTGGFSSIADATAFCGKVKAAGIACTLADF
jgi:hypothetical protein